MAAVKQVGKLSDAELEAAAEVAEQDEIGDNQVQRLCGTRPSCVP